MIARVPGERLPARMPNIVHLTGRAVPGAAADRRRHDEHLEAADLRWSHEPVTDFGDRSILIARSVSWSRDGQHIYAAVAERQTDVVLLAGLI